MSGTSTRVQVAAPVPGAGPSKSKATRLAPGLLLWGSRSDAMMRSAVPLLMLSILALAQGAEAQAPPESFDPGDGPGFTRFMNAIEGDQVNEQGYLDRVLERVAHYYESAGSGETSK